MAKKKTTLPRDFEDRLKQGDPEALKAVVTSCELDARGGYGKQTALAFDKCPHELAQWLVEQGADLPDRKVGKPVALKATAKSR